MNRCLVTFSEHDEALHVIFPASGVTVECSRLGDLVRLASGSQELVIDLDAHRLIASESSRVLLARAVSQLGWDLDRRGPGVEMVSRGLLGGSTTLPGFEFAVRSMPFRTSINRQGCEIADVEFTGQLMDLGSVDPESALLTVGMMFEQQFLVRANLLRAMLNVVNPQTRFDALVTGSVMFKDLYMMQRRLHRKGLIRSGAPRS